MIWVTKFIFSILVLICSSISFAFLDAAAQAARDAAKSAAYVGSIGELASELSDSKSVSGEAARLDEKIRSLSHSSNDLSFMSSEFESLARGPNWTSGHLDENIRYTSKFIARAKRMLITMGLLGLDAATAMNTAETNGALKEVLKNQQAQILMQKESEVERAETEIREKSQWHDFIENERALREKSKGMPSGNL